MGILFLVYACLHVYSAAIGDSENTSENNEGFSVTESFTEQSDEISGTSPTEKVLKN
jgi:hypothetical protein